MLLTAENHGDLWGLPRLTLENAEKHIPDNLPAALQQFFSRFFKKITIKSILLVNEGIWKESETFSQYTLYVLEIEPDAIAVDGLRATFISGNMLCNNLTSEAFDALSLPYVQSRLS